MNVLPIEHIHSYIALKSHVPWPIGDNTFNKTSNLHDFANLFVHDAVLVAGQLLFAQHTKLLQTSELKLFVFENPPRCSLLLTTLCFEVA